MRSLSLAAPPGLSARKGSAAGLMTQTIDDILSDFELFEDWDERYRYLIDLGRRLEPLPEAAKTEANKVRGCASQVWLVTRKVMGNDGRERLTFKGDSDAHIVKG